MILRVFLVRAENGVDLLFLESIQVTTSKKRGNSEMLQVVWLFDGFKFRHSQILYSGGVSDFLKIVFLGI